MKEALDTEIARTENLSFACGGILKDAKKVNFELSVKEIGKINIPFTSKQAVILKANSKAAPFDLGTETLVLRSFRDAWQVDAGDITLNDEFNRLMKEKMVEIVAYLMGESITEYLRQSIKEDHEIVLYKLVYYDKGGHYAAHQHQDTGMIATLVIQLPAGHKGGALIVSHKHETTEYNFEDDSRDNFFYTAFYGDCERRLSEVTSGHRLVLIYNIFKKNPQQNFQLYNATNFIENRSFITSMKYSVEEWKQDDAGPQYLVLHYEYLKGKAENIVNDLCSFADFAFFKATVTKKETRHGLITEEDYLMGESYELDPYKESDPELESETTYTLSNWENINDLSNWRNIKFKPFGNHTIDKDEILIDEKVFFDEHDEYCEQHKVENSGYAGCILELTYEKTVLVFCPKSHVILLTCASDFASVIAKCRELSESMIEEAVEMFKEIMFYIAKGHYKILLPSSVSDAIGLFESLTLFDNSIKSLVNPFFQALAKVGLPNNESFVALAKLINKLGWESLRPNVLHLLKSFAVSYTHSLKCAQLVSSMLKFKLQEEAIDIVEVATQGIILKSNNLGSEYWALWVGLLASYDIFITSFDECMDHISKMSEVSMIKIVAEMYRSLQPKVIMQERVNYYFQEIILILQENGWEKLSPQSVTLLFPVILFVEKLGKVSSLHSFAQSIIENKNSHILLESVLKLPHVIYEKDNPAVQLIFQTRLKQLEMSPPVFTWAQSKATLLNKYLCTRVTEPMTRDLHKFLRSNIQIKTFRGFENKRHATLFGAQYFNDGTYNEAGEYSAKHEISGKGKAVECKIIKTRNYFKGQLQKYNVLYNESKLLRKIYSKPDKDVTHKRKRVPEKDLQE